MRDTATSAPSHAPHQSAVVVLPQTNQLRAMHAIIRDRNAARADFVFHASRIIRLLVEEALNHVSYAPHAVETPSGGTYEGLRPASKLCGVSVIRAGESMEAELRAVCPGIRIGKILIQRDKITKQPKFYYENLPGDIGERQVLLLEPMLATGGTALAATGLLLEKGVREEDIVFVAFIAAPEGIAALHARYPKVTIVTSAVEQELNDQAYMLPGIGDFGDRFFGTTG